MSTKLGTIFVGTKLKSHKKAQGSSFAGEDSIKLDRLEKVANHIIFEVQTVPIMGFIKGGDKLTICTNRIAITRQTMFSDEERPIAIENITCASVYRHLMYASLNIDTFGVPKPEPITRLKIQDARLARRYILALIECKKAGIDLTKFELEELRERLKNLGAVRFTSEEKYHEL
ncbi:hypothetical protein IPM62_02135 [Candidatus Woesebacteria bacterium]|nr:MAG: hypothetical protein IPM62_02135 [Candidatus Woesebacteria bacterium]